MNRDFNKITVDHPHNTVIDFKDPSWVHKTCAYGSLICSKYYDVLVTCVQCSRSLLLCKDHADEMQICILCQDENRRIKQ
jgi:hypothetical protein